MKRWAMSCLTDGTALVACQMKVEPSGDWVEYADHLEALAAKDAEIAELKAQLAAAQPVMEFLDRNLTAIENTDEQYEAQWYDDTTRKEYDFETGDTPAEACRKALERMVNG